VRGYVAGVQSAIKYLANLFDNGHVNALGAGKFENGLHRRETLGGLLHLLHHVIDAVPLAQQSPGGVIARQRRLTGRDEVTKTGQAGQGFRFGSVGHREVSHFNQTAGDD
jgi:hypothetical protein